MAVQRYTGALERLIRRYGEDISLAEALWRESNPIKGRPRQHYDWIYFSVELAMDAGYSARAACDLLSRFVGSSTRNRRPDLSAEFLRNNHKKAKQRMDHIIHPHRAEHLRDWAQKERSWAAYITKCRGQKSVTPKNKRG
jgi:hypothetical protein